MKRSDGRRPNQLRDVKFTRNWTDCGGGSVLVDWGKTRVLCTAMLENGVPGWRQGSGKGWLTAEYGMLPSSTGRSRKSRPMGKTDSRATEIQRLIGRSLRAVVALERLEENTIHLDCDVLAADGGTRTAAITGSFVALSDLIDKACQDGRLARDPIIANLAAVSVALLDGRTLLDLNYSEDVVADVDMTVVMTAGGKLVEVQGCAEGAPFGRDDLDALIDLAAKGIRQLIAAQRAARKKGRRKG